MMRKKLLVGLVVVIVVSGLTGYWFSARQESDAPAMAILPPAQALAFVAMPGLPQAWADVRASKFYQHVSSPAFWQRALGPDGYARLSARLEAYLGRPLNEPTLNWLLGREVGLALVPGQDTNVDAIVYARISAAEKIAETLNRTFSKILQNAGRQTHTVDGVEIVTLHLKDAPTSVSYAFLGTLAVLSTDQAWVIDAINARHGTAPDRLHTIPVVEALQLGASESLLAYAYSDLERLQATTPAWSPATSRPLSPVALQMLQAIGKVTLKASRAGAGLMLDTMMVSPPPGATPALRQVERDGALPPFRGVPAETFYLTHLDLLDLQGLWPLLAQVAAMGDQDGWQPMLAEFRAWAGVDLEGDVLPLLTGVAGLGITAPVGAQGGSPLALPGVFLTLGLTDELQGERLLQRIGAHMGGPLFAELLQRRLHDGHTIYYLHNPLLFASPGYVINRQQLMLGSDVSLLKHMLDAASGKTTPLADTHAYQDVRQHLHISRGSLMFIDVTTAVQKVRDMWGPLSLLLRTLTPLDQRSRALGSLPTDPEALVELLRPIRYVGVASQAEAQGVRTEAFVAIQDLP